MTIGERIEFLMQSIESHDRQLGELVDRMTLLTGDVDTLTHNVSRLTETTQLNFESPERRHARPSPNTFPTTGSASKLWNIGHELFRPQR